MGVATISVVIKKTKKPIPMSSLGMPLEHPRTAEVVRSIPSRATYMFSFLSRGSNSGERELAKRTAAGLSSLIPTASVSARGEGRTVAGLIDLAPVAWCTADSLLRNIYNLFQT